MTTSSLSSTHKAELQTVTEGHSSCMIQAEPAPFCISGSKASRSLLKGLLCIACLMGVIWLVIFVCVCILLRMTNTPQVHVSCPGFWDFTLVSILSPLLLPALYMLSSSFLTLSWSSFSTGCLFIMSLLSLCITLPSSLSIQCVETLREITPPFPWLIFVGWFKCIIYFAGALSAVRNCCSKGAGYYCR